MSLMNKGQPRFRVTSLGFQHVVMLLLLLAESCEGQFDMVGPSQPIMSFLGDDVVLPCRLRPPVSAADMNVEWGRLDLQPRFVHVWYNKGDFLEFQNNLFKGRTSLSLEKLQHGDLSLTLSNVTINDNGIYRCYLPERGSEVTFQLIVGSASSPLITAIQIDSSLLALTCLARGWYPEPELSWLDGELLQDGATEISRGPDELYAVSSMLSVKEDYSRSITCRVTQSNINQNRETRINISASCPPQIPSISRVVMVLAVCIMLALAIVSGYRSASKESKELGAEGMLEGPRKSLEALRDQTVGLQGQMEKGLKAIEASLKKVKPIEAKGEEKEKEASKEENKLKEASASKESKELGAEGMLVGPKESLEDLRDQSAGLQGQTEKGLKAIGARLKKFKPNKAKGEQKGKETREEDKKARKREDQPKEASEGEEEARLGEEKAKEAREREEKKVAEIDGKVDQPKHEMFQAAKQILDENKQTLKQRETDDQKMMSDIEKLIEKIDDLLDDKKHKEAEKVRRPTHQPPLSSNVSEA